MNADYLMFTFLLSNAEPSICRQWATTFVPEMKKSTPECIEIQSRETLRVCALVSTSRKYVLTATRPFIHPGVCAQYTIDRFLIKKQYAKDSLECSFVRICKNLLIGKLCSFELTGHSARKYYNYP